MKRGINLLIISMLAQFCGCLFQSKKQISENREKAVKSSSLATAIRSKSLKNNITLFQTEDADSDEIHPRFVTNITTSNVELTEGGYQLSTNVDGLYVEEGYVELIVHSMVLSGRTLIVDGDDYYSIDETFDSVGKEDILLYDAISETDRSEINTTNIFSDARWASHILDQNETGYLKLDRSSAIRFYRPLMVGEDYDVSISFDSSHLGLADSTDSEDDDQTLSISLRYHDEDFNDISILYPVNKRTLDNFPIVQDTYEDGQRTIRRRIKTADCEDHLKYDSRTGIHESDVYFNFCEDEDGTAVVAPNGENISEEHFKYFSLSFDPNWKGDDGYVLLNSLKVRPVFQKEIQILNPSDDSEIQMSHWMSGVHIEELSEKFVKIRLYLRTDDITKTPKVSGISSIKGMQTSITVGDEIATFSEDRLGWNGMAMPKNDINDEDIIELESLCSLEAGAEQSGCYEFMSDFGITRHRYNFISLGDGYELTYSEDTEDFEIELTTQGELQLIRLKESIERGMNPLIIVSEVAEIWEDGELIEDYQDPTGARADYEQGVHLMSLYAQTLAELVYEETTAVDFQVGVETNINMFENDEDEATLLEAMGIAIKEGHPTANVSTSLNPVCYLYDTDYLVDVFGLIDSDAYDFINVNFFLNDLNESCGDEWQPEDFKSNFDWISTALENMDSSAELSNQWVGKGFEFGAGGFSKHIWDPYCNDEASNGRPLHTEGADDPEWDRGYGETRSAKMVSRATLSNLSTPARINVFYAVFDNETQRGGESVDYYCHAVEATGNNEFFDRVEGTGSIDGAEGATEYYLNETGKAYFTIGQHLSKSSPFDGEISVNDNDLSENETYHQGIYEDSDGNLFVALWLHKQTDYFNHYQRFANYYDGAYDNGLTETRDHLIKIDGIEDPATVGSVSLIQLDGSEEINISFRFQSGAIQLLDSIEFGDMPVLLKLAPQITDEEGYYTFISE